MYAQFNPFYFSAIKGKKKDMSYCVCSGKTETGGFTCKQHCKNRKKKTKKSD